MIRTTHLTPAIAALLSLSFFAFAANADDALMQRLADADPDKGAKQFRACAQCHNIGKGEGNSAGPNLWGVVSREVASVESYTSYSPALRDYGGTWTVERLDRYIEKPKSEVPKGFMSYGGLANDKRRADLIAYLNSMSDNPLDLAAGAEAAAPEAAEAEAAETAETAEEAEADDTADFGVLVAGKGAEETYLYCTACHSERIIAQQGLSRDHWDELLEWMVEEQGMSEIEEPDRTLILDYLAKNYGEDRPNFPGR